MFTRTLTASVLALGLLAPAAFAGNAAINNYQNGCSIEQARDGDFLDCKTNTDGSNTKGFAVGVAPSDGPLSYDLEGSTQSRSGVNAPSAN